MDRSIGWTTREFEFDSRVEYRHILFCTMPRPHLGHRVFCLPRTPDVDWPGLKLTTAFRLLPKLMIRTTVPPPLHTSAWPTWLGVGTNYLSLLNRKSCVLMKYVWLLCVHRVTRYILERSPTTALLTLYP